MAGTKAGGLKATQTVKAKYGEDFYKKAGQKGGRISRNGGFASNHQLAVEAGRKGGSISRRGKRMTYEEMRKIIILHIAGDTVADIAKKTGKDYNTVKRIVKRTWSETE